MSQIQIAKRRRTARAGSREQAELSLDPRDPDIVHAKQLMCNREAMTEDTLISLQSAATRIACQRMTAQHLNAMQASVEQASCLSARPDWGRKATAHAELFNLLGDSTGDPVLALLVGSATGWLHDLLMTVGPRADGIILSSRRRLLRHLSTKDADGAAREMEHHLTGLRYMGRLARGTMPDSTTAAS
jgi:DNA-binding FadR family transcriptional regulator